MDPDKQQIYQHDRSQVILKNKLISPNNNKKQITFKLPKGDWKKKLNSINKKTKKNFINKQNADQYSLSINNEPFMSDDFNKLEQILQYDPPPITIDVIPVIKANRDDDDNKDDNAHQLIIHYKDKQMNYNFKVDFEPEDDHLFITFKNAIKKTFKLNNNIVIYDVDSDLLDELEDIQNALDDHEDEDNYILHLNIKIDDTKVIKTMLNCTNSKSKEIIEFNQTMRTYILNNYHTHMSKYELGSELFNNVIKSLNQIRPTNKHDYNNLTKYIKDKILFWQKYSVLCLIQLLIKKCINIRTCVKSEFYVDSSLHIDATFSAACSKLLQIMHDYHKLKEDSLKNEFDDLITLCDNVTIKIPTQMSLSFNPCTDDGKISISNEQFLSLNDQPTFIKPYFLLKLVPNCHRLYYADINVDTKWNLRETAIKFRLEYNTCPSEIKPYRYFKQDDVAYFYNDGQMWNEIKEYQTLIMKQLLSEITNWSSYQYASSILKCIQHQIKQPRMYDKWKLLLKNLINCRGLPQDLSAAD